MGNTIAGAIGGFGGGRILDILLGGGAMARMPVAASGLDIGAIIQDVAGGGIGGAVLTIVVALIKGAMNNVSFAAENSNGRWANSARFLWAIAS